MEINELDNWKGKNRIKNGVVENKEDFNKLIKIFKMGASFKMVILQTDWLLYVPFYSYLRKILLLLLL